MKLNKNFIIHRIDEETMLLPNGMADFAGAVDGNETFGAILDLLEEDISKDELILSMCSKYDAGREIIETDVNRVLEELRTIGAIDD